HCYHHIRALHSFPTRRSSDLCGANQPSEGGLQEEREMDETTTTDEGGEFDPKAASSLLETTTRRAQRQFEFPSVLLTLIQAAALDRKSTRLNSSHVAISYAVF